MSKPCNDGTRKWTNDMEGEIMYVDRITLEGLEKYHNIEYEFLMGIKFDEGHYPMIGNIIEDLFKERAKFKKEKNPSEFIVKLEMNTTYGKTIERPHTKVIKYVNADEFPLDKLKEKYSGTLEQFTKVGKKWKLQIKQGIIDNWTMPQCGSIVLSQSKKLMMEAMHPVDEYVKYTDTDSMYITEKGLKILQETKPELFGKELGQFKFEFKLEGEE